MQYLQVERLDLRAFSHGESLGVYSDLTLLVTLLVSAESI